MDCLLLSVVWTDAAAGTASVSDDVAGIVRDLELSTDGERCCSYWHPRCVCGVSFARLAELGAASVCGGEHYAAGCLHEGACRNQSVLLGYRIVLRIIVEGLPPILLGTRRFGPARVRNSVLI